MINACTLLYVIKEYKNKLLLFIKGQAQLLLVSVSSFIQSPTPFILQGLLESLELDSGTVVYQIVSPQIHVHPNLIWK